MLHSGYETKKDKLVENLRCILDQKLTDMKVLGQG